MTQIWRGGRFKAPKIGAKGRWIVQQPEFARLLKELVISGKVKAVPWAAVESRLRLLTAQALTNRSDVTIEWIVAHCAEIDAVWRPLLESTMKTLDDNPRGTCVRELDVELPHAGALLPTPTPRAAAPDTEKPRENWVTDEYFRENFTAV